MKTSKILAYLCAALVALPVAAADQPNVKELGKEGKQLTSSLRCTSSRVGCTRQQRMKMIRNIVKIIALLALVAGGTAVGVWGYGKWEIASIRTTDDALNYLVNNINNRRKTSPEIVETLLVQYPDMINSYVIEHGFKGPFLVTILHKAVAHLRSDLVKLLLKKGSDPTLKDSYLAHQRTPLELAQFIEKDRPGTAIHEITQILRKRVLEMLDMSLKQAEQARTE